ncbi:MAG: hypothetical protein H0X42_09485 [Solirubrobacterales bacterium]|nr:hypothetical protein [Solirubrobacterales bacterium]
MNRVEGAKDFTVQLHAVDSPHYCNSYFERHLTLRHSSSDSLTWSDPGTSFRLSH